MSDTEQAEIPPAEERRRSKSPRKDKPRRKDAGFKWKEKRRDDDGDRREEGLRRGYREHYKPRSRSRSPRRGDRDRGESDRDYERRDRDRGYDRDRGRRRDDRRDADRDRNRDKDTAPDSERRRSNKPQDQRDKPAPPPSRPAAAPAPEMIVVTVNDRLGTKKQIPCLPTDTIKDFKSVVAMMIGRRPHEILLKRQSERPFKDFLTLQDYGVSNNVQLDLEVDTGD